jgi:molecular chaperone DnaK
MSRTTIDFGIDLGTTNSAIAVLRDVGTEVVKNNDNDETTPSAVWADKRGRLHVGRTARERSETDPENTCVEFKQRMGKIDPVKTLAGTPMTPEMLSAEVLKSLRANVTRRLGEDVRAAVITVPAAFDLSACDATRRAAELAGLVASPLLPEPTAAAHSYGFQATEENAMWLVYDLGGGTFDAAVIRLREGEFSVVRHAGDNFLGGKTIDWKIVDELLIPAAVARTSALDGLSRGDGRWNGSVAKLKLKAEIAKIELSLLDSVWIETELEDQRGRRHDFEYELRRADVERIAEPIAKRSINLCRDALNELGIGPADIEKVIMVGGQTAMPYLRERLADPVHGLGVPLEFDQDPMTVVARGAAIFAGGQPLEVDPSTVVIAPDAYTVRLEYPRVSPDVDPIVMGQVSGEGPLADLSVELVDQDSDPAWRSGRIRLTDRGNFSTSLWATRGKRHTYAIELVDATGRLLPVSPDRLTYTVGGVEEGPALGTTIAVGLDGNRMKPLIPQGAPLPARRVVVLRTTVTVQPGDPGGMLPVPVLEGVHARGDRNRRIGRIEVRAGEVARTVPAGSEVRLTIAIDTSRIIKASLEVPLLDQVFEHTINLNTESAPTFDELVEMSDLEMSRLGMVRERQRGLGSPLAEIHLARIDDEGLVPDVKALVAASRASQDEALAAHKRIIDLRVAVDAVEDELRWPELVEEAESIMAEARDFVNAHGSPTDRDNLPMYERRIADAVDSHDADLLRQRIGELQEHVVRMLDRGPTLQTMVFGELVHLRSQMRSPAQADRLIAEGNKAIDRGELERLRTINMQLQGLLDEQGAAGGGVRSLWSGVND